VARSTTLPDDFRLTDRMRQFAIDGGIEQPGIEFGHFKDAALRDGKRYVNWEAAWRTWCRMAVKFETTRRRR
jgi:hypothetical protein